VLHAPDRAQDGIGVCNEAQAALYEPNADEAITISLMSGISLVPYSACRHACSDPEELDVWGPDRLHGIFTKERRFFFTQVEKTPEPLPHPYTVPAPVRMGDPRTWGDQRPGAGPTVLWHMGQTRGFFS